MLGDQGDDGHAGGGDEADARREAVDAVDHVECVDERDNPEDGEDEAQPDGEGEAEAAVHAEAEAPGERGGEDLEEELRAGLEAEAVVEDAQRQEDGQRGKQPQHGGLGDMGEMVSAELQQGDAREGQQHPEAAAAGDCPRVDVAGEVRLVQHSAFREEPEQSPGQDKRDNSRHDAQRERHPQCL